jgi:alpha-glucosidase
VPGGVHEVDGSAADSVRLFARAGAIIPEAPVVQNTQQVPQGPLTLTVWPGADCSGSLYLDDGSTFAFQAGKFRRLLLSCEQGDNSLAVHSSSTGDFAPWWKELRVVLHAVPRAPQTVVDESGAKLPYVYDAAKKTLVVTLPHSRADFRVLVSW